MESLQQPTSLTVPLKEIGLTNISLDAYDTAWANLSCAVGLPGAENLNVKKCHVTIQEIAQDVDRIIFLQQNYEQFLDDPVKFHFSQAYFCVVCMISILQMKYGAKYQPKWKHLTPEREITEDLLEGFGKSAKDQFIFAIIHGDGGTCGSLPVYYAAVARTLHMPIRIVKAYRHLFLRWDDPDGLWLSERGKTAPSQGERFNIEATGPDIYMLSDDMYRCEWPRPIPQEYIDSGIYLKSLSPEEELSEFLKARSFCLLYNNRSLEAIGCLKLACRLAPHNTLLQALLERMMEFWQEGQHDVSYYVQPGRSDGPPKWPQWMNVGGKRLLVQYPQSGPSQASSSMEIGRSLTQRNLQMPNGRTGWFLVPNFDPSRPLEAFWVRTGLSDYVLVHRPVQGPHLPDPRQIGQPVVPMEASRTPFQMGQPMAAAMQFAQPKLLPHEVANLTRSIEQVKQHSAFTQEHLMPPIQNMRSLSGRRTPLLSLTM